MNDRPILMTRDETEANVVDATLSNAELSSITLAKLSNCEHLIRQRLRSYQILANGVIYLTSGIE